MVEHPSNQQTPPPALNVIILAGGSGKRFWPLSSEDLPKQFLPLLSEDPMIIETLKRLSHAPFTVRKVFVLTHERYKSWFESHPFFQKSPFETELVYEPMAKNTGPTLTWVALNILKSQSDPSPCLVLSADHWISPTDVFQQQVLELYEDWAQSTQPCIYTIGIPPTFPSTDYGYIECEWNRSDPISQVKSFKEKPNRPTAERYLTQKSILWNAGIFFFHPQALVDMIHEFCPEIRDVIPKYISLRYKHEFFRNAPTLSIDHALLEKTPYRKCLRAQFKWSDIGTWPGLQAWQSLSGKLSPYARIPYGDSTDRSITFTDHEHPVILLGCENLYVINCKGKILVAHQDHIHRLKEVIEGLPDSSR